MVPYLYCDSLLLRFISCTELPRYYVTSVISGEIGDLKYFIMFGFSIWWTPLVVLLAIVLVSIPSRSHGIL